MLTAAAYLKADECTCKALLAILQDLTLPKVVKLPRCGFERSVFGGGVSLTACRCESEVVKVQTFLTQVKIQIVV